MIHLPHTARCKRGALRDLQGSDPAADAGLGRSPEAVEAAKKAVKLFTEALGGREPETIRPVIQTGATAMDAIFKQDQKP
ncbi:hypothetical protein Q5762_32970 [Streptomyces sp. P9(2023)]|uniref:hypothetical protein n=1 Tax=Streptomyces sp. P9(2023) TaxID=3064394 RepID=UPI0028F441A7|nr:hypothetical protein [Streptomyces sp. P9(2023)]MDT9693053.1 hypothetical protein [Streptomyces sp. P9(2023)]